VRCGEERGSWRSPSPSNAKGAKVYEATEDGNPASAADAHGGALTPREHEVLELVGRRLREDEIAERLAIARSTVGMLLRSSMQKLEARTRLEAVASLDGKAKPTS
jgi:DNA-binding CsgD family transcriptional regulator